MDSSGGPHEAHAECHCGTEEAGDAWSWTISHPNRQVCTWTLAEFVLAMARGANTVTSCSR